MQLENSKNKNAKIDIQILKRFNQSYTDLHVAGNNFHLQWISRITVNANDGKMVLQNTQMYLTLQHVLFFFSNPCATQVLLGIFEDPHTVLSSTRWFWRVQLPSIGSIQAHRDRPTKTTNPTIPLWTGFDCLSQGPKTVHRRTWSSRNSSLSLGSLLNA